VAPVAGHLGQEPGLAAAARRCRTMAMASSSASVQPGAGPGLAGMATAPALMASSISV
jgi:hypothetical protein